MHERFSLLSLLATLALAVPAAASVEDARAAVDRGDYREAIELLDDEDGEEATLLKAETLWALGDYDDALRTARRQAESRRGTADATALYGRFLYLVGDYEGAVETLDVAVEGQETPHGEARYWRALALRDQGRRSRARLEMEDFIREYNRGEVDTVDELILVGLASHELENYHDANAAFREVLERDPDNTSVRLHWARLFLDKYRPDEAVGLLREVIERNPSHPEALGLLAYTEFETTYDLAAVRDLVDRALEVNPNEPDALEMLATLHMDSRDYLAALAALDRLAEHFPARLSSLALRAAIHYLRGDEEAFAEIETRVLELNPQFGEFFYVVGEFASRNFRYAEALGFHERAVELDAGFWPAYAGLGVSYSRVGDDGRALQFLRRAYDADPFNVQAFNMVELWESTLNDYRYVDDEEVEGMRYRFHRDERAILERFVPPVMQSTFETYVGRYGAEPPMPLSIEVFREPETFGVRSVGVPYAMQHGICFGHVVTSRSPSDGNFNWRQVLEHELSHVFSLHASNNRVPRWFTEGLAEYDTILGNEGWRREHDLAMIQALQRGTLISVTDLNRAFVSMNRPDAILEAYFQASLLVEHIGASHGYPALVEMLHAWGEDLQTPEVIERVLGQSVEEFDEAFADALRTHYGEQMSVFEPAAWWYSNYDERVDASKASPDEARVHAELGWAHYYRGDGAAAANAVARAMELDARDPYAIYLAGMLAWVAGQNSAANALFQALIDDGRPSATAHSVVAEWTRQQGDLERSATHLALAAELAPTDVMIVRAQAELAELQGDVVRQMEHLARAALLDQHDVESSLQIAQFALGRDDLPTASFFADRAIDVAPFRGDVLALSGRIAHRGARWSIARRDLELALDMGSDDRVELLRLVLDAYQALGLEEDATRVRRELIE